MNDGEETKMKTGSVVAIIGSIAAIVIVALGVVTDWTYSTATVADTTSFVTQVATDDFCANNPGVDLNVRIQDRLASSLTYQPATIYIKNLETGSIVTQAVTGSSTFTTATDAFKCTNKKGYELSIRADQDGVNSDEKVIITADMLQQDPVEVTMYTTNNSLLSVKAYDNDEKAKVWCYDDDVGGSTQGGFENVNGTFNCDSTTNATAKVIGADGFIDWTFTIKTVTANEQFGEGSYIAVNYADDTNADDWEGDTLELVWDGIALSEASAAANDIIALNAYEKVFKLPYSPGVDASGNLKTQHSLSFYIQTQSGVNADFDPVIRFVEIGDYQSQKDASLILEGVGFRDDSSRTAIGSATASTITIDVS